MLNFGAQLRKILVEMNLTQSDFARRIGTTSQAVNGWCQSGVIPRSDVLERLPELTGKPVCWFFMSDEESTIFSFVISRGSQCYDRKKELINMIFKLPKETQQHIIEYIETLL